MLELTEGGRHPGSRVPSGADQQYWRALLICEVHAGSKVPEGAGATASSAAI